MKWRPPRGSGSSRPESRTQPWMFWRWRGWSRFWVWMGCTVVVSTAPVLVNWIGRFLDGQNITKEILLGDGELFLIACALAAAGLGDALFAGKLRGVPLLAAIGCVLAVGGTASAYTHLQSESHHSLAATADASIFAFIFTVAASTVCVIMADARRRRV